VSFDLFIQIEYTHVAISQCELDLAGDLQRRAAARLHRLGDIEKHSMDRKSKMG
jgi:hypothetical protein